MIGLLILSTVPATASGETPAKGGARLDLTSPAFENNEPIPSEYTCDGAQLPPPLSWTKVPQGTRSIAILVEDPDAPKGTFTHWLVTGIPPTTTSLTTALPSGASASKNDAGTLGYTGPCPPSGTHRYAFRVYALDLDLPTQRSRTAFLAAIRGHVLASGQLVGTYTKRAHR
jgi:Raf kinase inhibitor-like YbhB/YbcL family protein